jgi:hypothetical protein
MTRSNGTLRSEFQLWNRCTIACGSVRSGSGRKELSPFSPWQERCWVITALQPRVSYPNACKLYALRRRCRYCDAGVVAAAHHRVVIYRDALSGLSINASTSLQSFLGINNKHQRRPERSALFTLYLEDGPRCAHLVWRRRWRLGVMFNSEVPRLAA